VRITRQEVHGSGKRGIAGGIEPFLVNTTNAFRGSESVLPVRREKSVTGSGRMLGSRFSGGK